MPIDLTPNEHAALAALNVLLGNSSRSILMCELRGKRGLVYGVVADLMREAGNKFIEIDLHGDADKMREIITIAGETLRGLAGDALTEADTEAPKGEFLTWRRMYLDRLSERVDDMSNTLLEVGAMQKWEQRTAEYEGLTSDDLRAIAHKVNSAEPSINCVGPVRQMPKAAEIRKLLKGCEKGKSLMSRLRLAS